MGFINAMAETLSAPFENIDKVAMRLPKILLLYTSMNRGGMSQSKITANIIKDCGDIGLMTGEMPDGTPNLLNEYTYAIVNRILEGMQMNGSIQVTIPPGAIQVQSEGANGGGPVVSMGTNLNTVEGYGIIV